MDQDALAIQALEQYNLQQPQLRLIRHNENLTYHVTDANSGEHFVLRVHKPVDGFSRDTAQHSCEALQAELEFVQAIRDGTDIAVQQPVRTRVGELVSQVTDPLDGSPFYATVLTWIDGHPMIAADPEWEHQAYLAGVMTAKLHQFAGQWHPHPPIQRQRYDRAMFGKKVQALGTGVSLGLFSAGQYHTLQESTERIFDLMDELSGQPDSFGLIHADLQKTNLIVFGETVTPIDFALSGYGYFLQDLGGLSADFGPLRIRQAMLDGYRTLRRLSDSDLKYVEAFFVAGILLFMATYLHNPKVHEWFGRRVPIICRQYIEPLVRDLRFFADI